MIPLDPAHWQELNQATLGIHTVNSRNALLEMVSKTIPVTLGVEQARWCEHGTAVPGDRTCPPDCFHDEILGLVLATSTSKLRGESSRDQIHGVFDLAALLSSSRSKRPILGKIIRQTRTKHYLATHFFITTDCGVLLTVRASSPFSEIQKFTLSLLREHLAIAARRHYPSDSAASPLPALVENSILTRREREVLPCLTQGMTNPEIATTLGISPRTVEKHVASILDKSGIDNRRMLIGLNGSIHHSFLKNG